MRAEYNIAVVGAGVAGLSAASLLASHGHRITLFDQFHEPQPIGSGLIVQPVGQRVLDQLGLLSSAKSIGVPIKGLIGHSHPSNRIALDADYKAGGSDTRGLALHRGALFDLLYAEAVAQGVQIETGQFALDAVVSSDPYIRFEGGGQAGPFDLVVDAAGAGSPLSPLTTSPLSFGALWSTIGLPTGEGDLNGILRQRYLGAHRMAGVLPIGYLPNDPVPMAAVFWSMTRDEHKVWLDRDFQEWKDEATQLWPDFGVVISDLYDHSDMVFATYAHGSLNKPYRNRVVHIGDAAHQASPQLGQGANMALIDAMVLSESIAATSSVPAALRRYTMRRLAHVKTYQALSRVVTPLYQSRYSAAGWARDNLVTPLTRIGPMRNLVRRVITGEIVPSGLASDARRSPPVRAVPSAPSREPGE